jgi:hypothetical protein
MGVGTSLILIAAGAILRWAVSVSTNGVDVHTIGIILLIIGIVGFVVSLFFWSSWGGFGGGGGYHRQRRVTPDGAGGYVEEDRSRF